MELQVTEDLYNTHQYIFEIRTAFWSDAANPGAIERRSHVKHT